MKQSIINQIKEHVSHDRYLEQNIVQQIIKEYPQFKYEGEAYRVLCFSEVTESCSLESDSSFSSTLRGALNYHSVQDIDYYPHVQLYKANIIGLDLIKIVKHFKIEVSKELIERESEVILGQLNHQELIFNGLVKDFDTFIKEKYTL